MIVFTRMLFTLTFTAASTAMALASVPPSAMAAPSPAAAATAAPPPAENPVVTSEAKTQFLAWQAGKIDRSLYSAEANKQLTDALVSDVSAKLGAMGAPTKVTFLDQSTVSGNVIYTYGVDTPKGKLQMLFALDKDNKISGIFFRPAP